MRIIMLIVSFITVIIVAFNFVIYTYNQSSSVNIQVFNKLFSSYTPVTIMDNELSEKIDYNDLIEKYDLMLFVDKTIYVDIKSIDGLYGTTKSCSVPFNVKNNDCSAIINYSFFDNVYNIDSFENNNSSSVNLRVKTLQIDQFSEYIMNKYDIDKEDIIFSSSSYNYMSSDYIYEDINITLLLATTIIIFTVMLIVKNRRHYLIYTVNGNSLSEIFLKNILSKFIVDSIVIFISYILSVFFIYLFFNEIQFYLNDYIRYSFSVVLAVTILPIFISFITFYILMHTSIQNLLKLNVKNKRILISVFVIYLFTISYFAYNLPTNKLVSAFYQNQYNIKQDELSKYKLYNLKVDDFNYKNLSDNEISELNDLISSKPYFFSTASTNTEYMSADYAKLIYDIDYGNKNYFLDKKCDNVIESDLDVIKENSIIYNSYKSKNAIDPNVCVVVLGDDNLYKELIMENYYQLNFISDTDISNYTIIGQSGMYSSYAEENLDTSLVYMIYLISIIITAIITVVIFYVYLITYSRYEYIRYIFDRNYLFLGKYILTKLVLNSIILLITLFTGSLLWFFTIIVTDVVLYLFVQYTYHKRLIKLGGII